MTRGNFLKEIYFISHAGEHRPTTWIGGVHTTGSNLSLRRSPLLTRMLVSSFYFIISTKEVMFLVGFVCLFVRNGRILMKVLGTVGNGMRKK